VAHVLVTGGAGYAGSALVDRLLADDHKVTVVDWMVFGEHPLQTHKENPNFTLLRHDVRSLPPRALDGVDVICDLAALSNDPAGELDTELTRDINFHARARLGRIAKALGVKRYILASSCSVYGVNAGAIADENSPTVPQTVYAECNQEAEDALLALSDKNFAVTCFRNGTMFGLSRRMRFDLVINVMTLNAFKNGKLFVHGDGKQHRPFIHLRDVARAFAHVIDSPVEKVEGRIFNLGVDNMTIADLAENVKTVLPLPVELEFVPASADNRDYTVSFDAMHNDLGFMPETQISEGIMEVFIALRTGRTTDSFETRTLDVYSALIMTEQLHLYSAAGS